MDGEVGVLFPLRVVHLMCTRCVTVRRVCIKESSRLKTGGETYSKVKAEIQDPFKDPFKDRVDRNKHKHVELTKSKEENALEEAVSTLRAVKNKTLDEDDVYGQTIAFSMRSIKDPRKRAYVKLKIQEVIFQTQFGHMDNQFSTHGMFSPSYVHPKQPMPGSTQQYLTLAALQTPRTSTTSNQMASSPSSETSLESYYY